MRVLGLGAIVFITVFVSACPKPGFMAAVSVPVLPETVPSIRAAFLSLGGFEGSRKMQGNPNCFSYEKRLPSSAVSVAVNECYEASSTSETGWVYRVLLYTWGEGRDPKVRADIESLAEKIRQVIQEKVPNAKVAKDAGALAMPF